MVTSCDGLQADAHLTSTPAHPPHRPAFTVTLTAEQDVVLDPCPDYAIGPYLGEERYALSCAAVPTRDARGRPFLPAGQPVTFAMRTRLLADAPGLKLVWTLGVPQEPATAVLLSAAR